LWGLLLGGAAILDTHEDLVSVRGGITAIQEVCVDRCLYPEVFVYLVYDQSQYIIVVY